MKIEVYSDGSSDGKSGGIGGWAYVVVVDGTKVHEGSGSEPNATNNTMEVLSATKGLEWVNINHPNADKVVLISDSQLALRWADGTYKVKKYHLIPYVIALKDVFKKVKAETRWERGHQGEKNNERCDALAKAAREPTNNLQQREENNGKT